MTLIFPPQGYTAAQPETHALIIGVGDYPYMLGGALQGQTVPLGLGQLTSSPVSATAFTNLLVEEYKNAAAPLGSVELLLSPGVYDKRDGTQVLVEDATMNNIQQAFDRWEARCHTSADNIAIFYFCGHGLERTSPLLLPQDFGINPRNLWDQCIDLEATWRGMRDCNAKTQCYFLDCCRETPLDVLKSLTMNPRALKSTSQVRFPLRNAPIFQAAPVGQKAFGRPNNVSYFTDGLIRCFRGLAVERQTNGKWIMTTDSLSRVVKVVMLRSKNASGLPSSCDVAGQSNFTTDLHEVTGTPEILAQISCQPPHALGDASFAIHAPGSLSALWSRNPNVEPWELEVPVGSYDVHVDFPNGTFTKASQANQIAYPPIFQPSFSV